MKRLPLRPGGLTSFRVRLGRDDVISYCCWVQQDTAGQGGSHAFQCLLVGYLVITLSGPRSKAFGEYQLAMFDQLVRVKLLRPLLY